MLNRTPPSNKNTSDVLNSYRKRRQQRGPYLIYGLAAILLIGGIALVVRATSSGNNPIGKLFPTDTPTPTLTFTPTNTNTPTLTPTETLTPTITLTSTPSAPFPYTVQENEGLGAIAEKFNLGDDGIALLYYQNPQIQAQFNGVVQAGQTILIPLPGTVLPTLTPIPPNLPRGTKIKYTVLSGDTLAGIAVRFNSIEQNIIDANNLENPNSLDIGQILDIPVNLVTATPTLPSSSTPVTPTIEGQPTLAAATATAGSSSTSTCSPTENDAYISELQTLINNARTPTNLPALAINQKLSSVAKAHATDMICNNYLSHVGLNGSTPETRVAAQGYTASVVVENLFALSPAYGGNPQAAVNWWMSDATSKANILDSRVTEFGIAYVASDKSLLGGYFVVVFAKP